VYHLNLKNYVRAAQLYQEASKQPGAPGAAVTLAGTALANINGTAADRLVAAAFWETVYEKATDQGEKDRAKAWYEELQIVYSIEISAQQYKAKTGNYPADIQALVTAGYLSSYPASPAKRIMVLDPANGKVDFSKIDYDAIKADGL
jgi:hypothetical protein